MPSSLAFSHGLLRARVRCSTWVGAFTLALCSLPAAHAQPPAAWPPVPALTAHRGASALWPEMTLPAFEQALRDGADLLELDVVLTRDGVLLVRHENALSASTNVADLPQFADRKTTKTVDGRTLTDWFAEDFTWPELQTLRATERYPQLRPANAARNGQLPLLQLQQVADLVHAHNAQASRPAGLFIELKQAAHAKAAGLDMRQAVLDFLEHNQWNRADAPVQLMSFEVGILQALRAHSPVRIFQLLSQKGGPPDRQAQGTTYAQMATPQGLADIQRYAQGVSLLRSLAAEAEHGRWVRPSALTRAAQAAGLQVHVWTLRPENQFLTQAYQSSHDRAQRGDAMREAQDLLATGVEGLIADDPGALRAAFSR